MKGFEPRSTEWEFRVLFNHYTIESKNYDYSEDIAAIFHKLLGIKYLKIHSITKIY